MEKATDSSLFVNDGSFMERFKQLQQEKETEKVKTASSKESKTASSILGSSTPKAVINKPSFELKANASRKTTTAPSGGKLAFSLKQKSKIAAPSVKLGDDEDEDEKDAGNSSGDGPIKRQRVAEPGALHQPVRQIDVAPNPPSDPTVKKVADKLASFVAKNGRQFEHITRQKNPGDTPFKFLFDESCPDYKYYEYRLSEEERALSQTTDAQTSLSGVTSTATPSSTSSSHRSHQQHSNYQIPASALYGAAENTSSSDSAGKSGHPSGPSGSDPISMMEYYMKKAAEEEKLRPYKSSKDEMPPPASLQAPGKKGHHMGDYIPPEELAKFLSTCNDVAARKAAIEAAERSKIQADNIGHKLLSKMGWKEGEGLGSSKSGIADPITAGNVKSNNLGVGASQPGEVTPEDDIYEQYKKRMMLGYKYRPNPLNNPRKAYY
ncbi:SURP and G-patch domain-containing protein 1-like protein [Nicotiana tabacum]|uniref:SURP and G-patch domain-containing protein 1-like protein n=3 Tax=Nicotiana TaxID=4085 RepID=A0AC58TRP2_TOBAC|nr:PREDICTED: SURP and G-patch domain-containing protein 1-like protein [Nicotiana sylvestris]XP_009757641.1 PREDICTED: SURP and G-patch domain-containing protein 1-like protein [Nicotiana sylvestris]